jgi:NAD(P)H dehydrogenase (quinone)
MSWKMKKWWDDRSEELWSQVDGKIGGTFSSAGGYGGGAEMTCLSLTNLLMNFGFLVFGTTDYVAKRFTLHYGATVAKAPRASEEADACRRLGLRLAEWVAFYVDGYKDLHPLLTTKKDGAWNPNSDFFKTAAK